MIPESVGVKRYNQYRYDHDDEYREGYDEGKQCSVGYYYYGLCSCAYCTGFYDGYNDRTN